MLVSVIVPLYNEEENVAQLHKEIKKVFRKEKLRGEFIFVDDGSSDKTLQKLKKLKPIKIISFRKNFGQTAAMDAGIKEARGKIIVTMDGDLQNDPADIPKLLKKLKGNYDVISGWRKKRQDSFSKKFLSRGADWLRSFLIKDGINDSGCSLKVYRKECFEDVDLYGEMHRFIPAILKIKGFRIGEMVVNHRPRLAGVTKYNFKRVAKGFLDMLSVWFWRKFAARPLHLFGFIGMVSSTIGSGLLAWMFVERVFLGEAIGNRIWPTVGIFMILTGIQFFVFGLLADILIKTFHKVKNEHPYNIKEIIKNK
ncbi:MAG: glycosyltransferase family 2 protein [Candidatus Moranbacteria bacterium]|nr:glycosyltransferase family 2 protein [Candidatus Moranbacteria bacterium]